MLLCLHSLSKNDQFFPTIHLSEWMNLKEIKMLFQHLSFRCYFKIHLRSQITVIPSSWRHLEHIVWWCSSTRIGEGNVHQRPRKSLLSIRTQTLLMLLECVMGKQFLPWSLLKHSRDQCHALR